MEKEVYFESLEYKVLVTAKCKGSSVSFEECRKLEMNHVYKNLYKSPACGERDTTL